MKTKRAILNVVISSFSKMISVVLGVILPKLYIDYFGSEVNGLLSSISGIFVYINLLEAGVGGAAIQALYAPITQKDQDRINGILSATGRYYKSTGIYFLACVSVIAFLYPLAARSDIPYGTIVIIIFLSSASSALSYFFQGKYTVLLNADNRGYILSEFSAVFNTLSSIVKIVLILSGFNILVVQSAFSFISILQVIGVLIYVRRAYPGLNLLVCPDNKAIIQKNSVIVHQIASTVFNNTDVLILTFFLGLKVVSVYAIYNMIFSQAGFLPGVISDGLTAGFGQLYSENKEKFKRLFNFFEVYYTALVFALFISAYVLIIPFLKLYTAGITDINYIDAWLPLLFLSVNLLSTARWPSVIVINVAGHFKQTRWRALLEMIINLVFSITLVNVIGIYGVLLGTAAALLYRTFDIIIYSSRHLLDRSILIPAGRLALNVILGIAPIFVFRSLNIPINNYFQFAIAGCALLAATGLVYFSAVTLTEYKARTVLFEYRDRIFGKLFGGFGKQEGI